MNVLTLTANLGNFDTPVASVMQENPPYYDNDYVGVWGYQFNDTNFPPITGLSSRLQYRIPKLFGLEMLPADIPTPDIVVWYDSSMSLQHPDSVKWFIKQLGNADMAFFKHPWRNSIYEEVQHIEEKLRERNEYIVKRYENGLHKEMYRLIEKDAVYRDNCLLASTAFIYRNTPAVQKFMREWWFYQSRYYTCDQVHLPYALYTSGVDVKRIDEDIFNNPYISLVSKHK